MSEFAAAMETMVAQQAKADDMLTLTETEEESNALLKEHVKMHALSRKVLAVNGLLPM